MWPFVKLQSRGQFGRLPRYSCDYDEAFCQITLDRCKLQLRKSTGDATFCRITMTWRCNRLSKYFGQTLILSERNR